MPTTHRPHSILAAAAMGGALALASVTASADTLVIAAPSAPEGFDGDALRPHTQNVVVQVYEGLTRYGRTTKDGREVLDASEALPHLAESWEVLDDGRRYVFKLREGIKSPYGNELTADDVEWSWSKSFDQKRTGNFIARVSNVTGVKALSKYEVEFTLSAPSSIFVKALTLYVPGIYDSTEVKKHATAEDPWGLEWMEANTAGFGAYHLDSVKPGDQAVFVANPNYFRDPPFFDRVIYKQVPSGASRVTLLKAGQVQWIDRPAIQQVIDMQKDPKVKVDRASGRSSASVRMNPTCKPFDDVRVRQAINYAVDADLVNEAVFAKTADLAKSVVPPIVPGYNPGFFEYEADVARAKQLLAEAGYADGFEVELLYSDLWWHLEPITIQIADQLNKLGLNVKPTRITGSEMRSRASPKKMDMCFFAFEDGPIVLDPVYTLFLVAHTKGVSNRAAYSNPDLDALIDAAREELDETTRLAQMDEAQKLWLADSPWIMTVYPATFEAMSPKIRGWVHHPDEHERWYDLRYE